MIRLSDVPLEDIAWLWPHRFPLGKVSLLFGEPGASKSYLTADMAARVTVGREWPDGSGTAPLGNVLLIGTEDALGDTVRHRIQVLGGNVDRVFAWKTPLNLAHDIERLRRAVEVTGVKLIVIDPVMQFVGSKTDTHRDSAVRLVLNSLAELAQETGACIILILHTNKDETKAVMNRASGSIAFTAVPRAVYLVAREDTSADARRFLASVKFSIGPYPATLAYRLKAEPREQHAKLVWEAGTVSQTASEILRRADGAADGDQAQDAASYLRENA